MTRQNVTTIDDVDGLIMPSRISFHTSICYLNSDKSKVHLPLLGE